MPHDPDLIYIPADLTRDRRLTPAELELLLRLIARAGASGRCDLSPPELARAFGSTPRTIRKRLTRLEGLGLITGRAGAIELNEDLLFAEDAILASELPPLSDEDFARLQEAEDPSEFETVPPGKRLFVGLPRSLVEGCAIGCERTESATSDGADPDRDEALGPLHHRGMA